MRNRRGCLSCNLTEWRIAMKMVNFKFGLRAEYLPCLIIPRFKSIPMTKGFPTSSGGFWLYKKRNVHCRTPAQCSFRTTNRWVFLPTATLPLLVNSYFCNHHTLEQDEGHLHRYLIALSALGHVLWEGFKEVPLSLVWRKRAGVM